MICALSSALQCQAMAGAAYCAQPGRIVGPINASRYVVMHGNRSPRAARASAPTCSGSAVWISIRCSTPRYADQAESAAEVPLPRSMAGTPATINGIAAPLYYVSPTQLNFQIPYQTPAGTAMLGVKPQRAGGLVFFRRARLGARDLRGGGWRAGTNDTPVSKLPAPRLPLTMTVGGVPVTPFFVGIPYGLVGLTQINFTLPSNIPPGTQPVVVTVGGVASATAEFTVTGR